MTAQIGDHFKFNGTTYSIAAISSPLRFNPRKYGIIPESACTACWDGYWCVYNITDEGIFLEDLYINSANDFYPEIEGITPETDANGEDDFSYMGHHLYKGLNLKVNYTGRILIGDEFLYEYYIHMGYQRPWAYEVLTELVFENGTLIETNDQSQIAADLREKINRDEAFAKQLYSRLSHFSDGEIWWL